MADKSANECPSDKPIGTTMMILGVLAWIASLLLVSAIVQFLWAFVPNQAPTLTFNPGLPGMAPLQPASIPAYLTLIGYLLPTVLCGLIFCAGAGIRKGTPWAFNLSIVVCGLTACLGGGGSAIGLAFLSYCVLRLAGVIGRSPSLPITDTP